MTRFLGSIVAAALLLLIAGCSSTPDARTGGSGTGGLGQEGGGNSASGTVPISAGIRVDANAGAVITTTVTWPSIARPAAATARFTYWAFDAVTGDRVSLVNWLAPLPGDADSDRTAEVSVGQADATTSHQATIAAAPPAKYRVVVLVEMEVQGVGAMVGSGWFYVE